jgi:hypothetical protein
MSYLAKEFLNGFSQKAMYMYVPPLALVNAPVPLGLKPFDKKSQLLVPATPVASASDKLGTSIALTTLYVFRDVSKISQLPVVSVRLIITNLGLNPVNTKGPSVLPLPV